MAVGEGWVDLAWLLPGVEWVLQELNGTKDDISAGKNSCPVGHVSYHPLFPLDKTYQDRVLNKYQQPAKKKKQLLWWLSCPLFRKMKTLVCASINTATYLLNRGIYSEAQWRVLFGKKSFNISMIPEHNPGEMTSGWTRKWSQARQWEKLSLGYP